MRCDLRGEPGQPSPQGERGQRCRNKREKAQIPSAAAAVADQPTTQSTHRCCDAAGGSWSLARGRAGRYRAHARDREDRGLSLGGVDGEWGLEQLG